MKKDNIIKFPISKEELDKQFKQSQLPYEIMRLIRERNKETNHPPKEEK